MIIIIIIFIITFIIFCIKENSALNKIINFITFFKLNPEVVNEFLKRGQNEDENRKNKKNNKLNNNSNMPFSRRKKIKKKRKRKERDIRDKKAEINNKNIIKQKNTSINSFIIDTRNNKSDSFNKIIFPDNLNEEQAYSLFLKIDKNTDFELNDLNYEKAIKIDNRKFSEYYISLVRTKHLLFYSFWPSFDYNSQIIKIYLFFFNFSLNLTVNALFFNDESMHKIYIEQGSFNFIYNIPQILYSAIISGFISGLISFLSQTSQNIIKLKQEAVKENALVKRDKTIKIIKIKYSLFFIINLIIIIIFCFYLACFCAVYKNTQIHLIKDTLICFSI